MCFGFYGWAVPYVFMEDASSEAITGTYLLIASGGTFIPLAVTRNRPVSMGAALMSWYGMSRGALHGALIPNITSEDPDSKAAVGTALALSVAEGIAGFEWASRTGMSEGTAATLNNLGDFGTLYGLGLADLADVDHQAASASALAGAGAGLITGVLYSRGRDHSYGDASVMRTGGIVGGYLGIAVVGAADPDDDWSSTTTVAAMVGSVGGLAIGHGLVKHTDFSFGQGVIVDFSTIGGWLFGLGGAYLATDNGPDESMFWVLTGLGTVAGYAIGYGVSAKSARRAAADRSSWQFDVMPLPPPHGSHLPGVSLTLRTSFD
jgi:hypothetical protein